MSEPQAVSIRMVRENPDHIPEWPLPDGFRFHWFRPGDQAAWLRIHRESGGYTDIDQCEYDRSFGDDAAELGQRQAFITSPDGREIATATAWFGDPEPGLDWGRIHWVAVARDMQGRGLAKPLLSTVLQRLAELGHRRAYLTTQGFRIPAINLYLAYGFRPQIMKDADRIEWQRLKESGLPIDAQDLDWR